MLTKTLNPKALPKQSYYGNETAVIDRKKIQDHEKLIR
jgi:hypothetical protein